MHIVTLGCCSKYMFVERLNTSAAPHKGVENFTYLHKSHFIYLYNSNYAMTKQLCFMQKYITCKSW